MIAKDIRVSRAKPKNTEMFTTDPSTLIKLILTDIFILLSADPWRTSTPIAVAKLTRPIVCGFRNRRQFFFCREAGRSESTDVHGSCTFQRPGEKGEIKLTNRGYVGFAGSRVLKIAFRIKTPLKYGFSSVNWFTRAQQPVRAL